MIAERYISIDLRSKLGTILVLHALPAKYCYIATMELPSSSNCGMGIQLSFWRKNLERTPHLNLPFGALIPQCLQLKQISILTFSVQGVIKTHQKEQLQHAIHALVVVAIVSSEVS